MSKAKPKPKAPSGFDEDVHIVTERLVLREWRDEDMDHFSRMNGDALIMEYMPRTLDRRSSDALVERFREHFKKHGFGLYAAALKSSGEFIGFVGLNTVDFKAHFTPAVEIAWRLDYSYWGKGYASEAAQAVLHHAFTALKLKEVVSFTVFDNTRSIGVMENIGMTRDPKGDFDYPALKKDHPLGRFVLYRMTADNFKKSG